MTDPAGIRAFFRASCLYLLIALCVALALDGDPVTTLRKTVEVLAGFGSVMGYSAAWAVPAMAVMFFTTERPDFRRRLGAVLWTAAACILLQAAFFFLKSAIPALVPYYADPALAALDRGLHGGTDPWVYAHRWAAGLPMGIVLPFYLQIWAFPAVALPVFIAMSDPDAARSRTYLALFFGTWVILGNIAALAGSSVGPVFYDALLGGSRFADLTAALRMSPVEGSLIGEVQKYLWINHAAGGFAPGAAISAFPSLHVAIAALLALYIRDRSPYLAPLGYGYLALVLFLSVYTGYHYAVDGYAAIAGVVAGRAWLGRWARHRRAVSVQA